MANTQLCKMDFEHDLVVVDEFDALAIQLKVPPKSASAPPKIVTTAPKTATPPATAPAAAASQTPQKQKTFDSWQRSSTKPEKYPAKLHAQKVAKELGVQNGIVFIPGQHEKLYEDSDMGPEFRQRRYFYYISGANFPGCSVTYDIARDHLVLWIPFTDPRDVLWYGKTPTVEETRAITQVDDVRLIANLDRFLYAVLTPGSTLFVLHNEQTPGLDTTKGLVHIDTVRLKPAMDRARVIKTDYEIEMIRRANAVSSAAHKAVLTRVSKLSNERELEAIIRGFCQAQGAKRQAYPVIAGSGVNASTLHYDANNQPLAGRQLVCLDGGAEWDCYASDITRTFPLSGTWSTEAGAIYKIVDRMQRECIRRIMPGVIYSDLHKHACTIAVTELLKLDILQGEAAEILSRGTVAAFFPHGLGHHVGLEVHDVEGDERLLSSMGTTAKRRGSRVRSKRDMVTADMLATMFRETSTMAPRGKRKLEKGMVVTVEPGIYFCKEFINAYFLDNSAHSKFINKKVLEKYWDVGGVRIEDCILVTEKGWENLTWAPKGEEALKIIKNGA